MNIWTETNWFAVQAKPYRERLAAGGLARLDLDVFLPEMRREQLVGGVWRLVTKPLFPGYFFAKFAPAISLDVIRNAHGVLRVLGSTGAPIPLSRELISELQQRIQPDGFIRFETKPFQPGDRVRIEQGPLAGWSGTVEREWDDNKRVAILLEAIQQARVLIEKRSLALAAHCV